MWLLALGYLCLLLKEWEGEPPLFHPQDDGSRPGALRPHCSAYYLCYRYPRPWWWISNGFQRLRDMIAEVVL